MALRGRYAGGMLTVDHGVANVEMALACLDVTPVADSVSGFDRLKVSLRGESDGSTGPEPVWVFDDDVIGCVLFWFLHIPVPVDNERDARSVFERCKDRFGSCNVYVLGTIRGVPIVSLDPPTEELRDPDARARRSRLQVVAGPQLPWDLVEVKSELLWCLLKTGAWLFRLADLVACSSLSQGLRTTKIPRRDGTRRGA